MHDLKSTPKRYQNPEVFEQLAYGTISKLILRNRLLKQQKKPKNLGGKPNDGGHQNSKVRHEAFDRYYEADGDR